MPERLIPIAKKQHDSFNNVSAAIKAANHDLTTMANTILQGVDEDLGQVNVLGVDCRDGVYSLVIDVPEPPKESA